uniref:Immunoglobulin heavy variable 5-1 n=1 Tax=Sinocyclocheilus grahami TaxID=75366 RepID=A0A672K4K1_SINGR
MISSSLVLLLAVISCKFSLLSPESLTVRPDATLTINCKVSYSVTSEHTGWIRQLSGKALEWIGFIWSDGNLAYKDSLKSKFSISRDTSSNTITLQGKNMQAEDTAVYYCARETQ